jgi:hypothetical protein
MAEAFTLAEKEETQRLKIFRNALLGALFTRDTAI